MKEIKAEDITVRINGTRVDFEWPAQIVAIHEHRRRSEADLRTHHERFGHYTMELQTEADPRFAQSFTDAFKDALRTRYQRRRAHYTNGKARRWLEPHRGRAWRRFRRNFLGGPLLAILLALAAPAQADETTFTALDTAHALRPLGESCFLRDHYAGAVLQCRITCDLRVVGPKRATCVERLETAARLARGEMRVNERSRR